jgi:glycerol-3-phosphate dehydrogenase
MALTLSDVVLRRLDLGTAGPPSEADLETVTRTMATHLGWDSARVGAERAALAKRFPPA